MRSLRILQIVPTLAPVTGGPTQSVPATAKALVNLGHKVVQYTTTWPDCKARNESFTHVGGNLGYEVVTFPAQKSIWFPDLPYSPALVRAVEKHCREFDIVHNYSLWNPVATFSLHVLNRTGMTYCLSPLGMLDPIVLRRHRLKKLLWALFWERANVEKASLIQFTSTLEEERARGSWKLPRTLIAPHIFDMESWKKLPERNSMESRHPQLRGREVILFVGRINWVKNLHILLEALVKVRKDRPKAMLVCVGPDSENYQSILEKQANELGIRDHIVFTGMLQGEDLRAAYARADAFALVSQKENFGYVVVEALACGIPVVLSTGVGIGSDLPVRDYISRVEPRPEPIASAIIQTLQRSAKQGLPDPDARAMVNKFFDNSEGIRLLEEYCTILFGASL
jgi:glycosyltransferase involved in cell wall biosynthesis